MTNTHNAGYAGEKGVKYYNKRAYITDGWVSVDMWTPSFMDESLEVG